MNDAIRLTSQEWEIVAKQCGECCHWDYRDGCQYPQASSPEPVEPCKMFYKRVCNRGGLNGKLSNL